MFRHISFLFLISHTLGERGASPRWLSTLTTGNGLGFTVFNTTIHGIESFFDYPYRFVLPNATDPSSDGKLHRDLVGRVLFGVGPYRFDDSSAQDATVSYVDQTHIIQEDLSIGPDQLAATQRFFMPFGYAGNTVVGYMSAESFHQPFVDFDSGLGPSGFESSGNFRRIRRLTKGVFVETGSGEGAIVYYSLTNSTLGFCYVTAAKTPIPLEECSGFDITFRLTSSSEFKPASIGFAMEYVETADEVPAAAERLRVYVAGRNGAELISDALDEFAKWRAPPVFNFRSAGEELLWRQSETVLRMSQLLETNRSNRTNHGMILASLPPGQWAMAWVRDGCYAIVALVRTGHFAEAKLALNSLLNAKPVGLDEYKSYVNNAEYRISITRYIGDGSEQGDKSGYSTPNVELDDWGLFLWASRQYLDFSHDTAWLDELTSFGRVYDVLVKLVATPLELNLEVGEHGGKIVRADSGIWEAHEENAKHFSFTTMAAARGFCDMAAISAMSGSSSDQQHFAALAADVRTGFNANFVISSYGIYSSIETIDLEDVDSMVLEAFTWGLIDDDDAARAHLENQELLNVATGGYKRNNGSTDYEKHDFLWVDFKLCTAWRQYGKSNLADEMIEKIVNISNANFGLIAENYNSVAADGPIGAYINSFPMVGYGPGAFVITLLDRDGLMPESRTC